MEAQEVVACKNVRMSRDMQSIRLRGHTCKYRSARTGVSSPEQAAPIRIALAMALCVAHNVRLAPASWIPLSKTAAKLFSG